MTEYNRFVKSQYYSTCCSSYLPSEAARQTFVDARRECARDSYDKCFERLGLHVLAQIENHNPHLGGGRGGQRRNAPNHLEKTTRTMEEWERGRECE